MSFQSMTQCLSRIQGLTLVSHFQELTLKTRFIAAFFLGIFSILAQAPIHWFAVLPLAFSAALFLISSSQSARESFKIGWSFGCGFFISGLYWLAYPLKIVGLWYLMPLGAIALPCFLAIFSGTSFALTTHLTKTSLGRSLCLATTWAIMEWLRGHILTGFPWNLLGYTWDLPLLQTTSFWGIYGLSFLTALWATSLYSRHKIWIMCIWSVMGGLWASGYYTMSKAGDPQPTATNIRIVQASIPQDQKWLAEKFRDNLDKHLALSMLEAEKPLTAIIWPEAAVPVFAQNIPALLDLLKEAVPENGYLLFGAPRHPEEAPDQIRTSLLALSSTGIVKSYDKAHLVPFGEYIPLGGILKVSKLTHGDEDFSPGPGIQTISLPNLPAFSPLICYEAIFPGAVAMPSKRPEWLLNITNDAWYGHSSGPYQHLANVRVRAIEERIPLVRAANNGISAVVDPYGRILYRLELDDVGFIDFNLPKAFPNPSIYSLYGDSIFFIFFGLASVMIFFCERKKRK